MGYDIPVPRPRGFKPDPKCTLTHEDSVTPCVNDVFLHSLFARVALSNNDTIEFETFYNPDTNLIELDIPTEYIDIFNQVTGMQRGECFKRFIDWLIGSETISGGPSTITSESGTDVAFVSAGDMVIWSGATTANVDGETLTLLLPISELAVVGLNSKLGDIEDGTDIKISLVWIFDSGDNTEFEIQTTAKVTELSSPIDVVTTVTTQISTFNLLKGDIRETQIMTLTDPPANSIVSVTFRRIFDGTSDPGTELVGIVGARVGI